MVEINTSLFKLRVPKEWEYDHEESIHSLVKSLNGFGALQIQVFISPEPSSVFSLESLKKEYQKGEMISLGENKLLHYTEVDEEYLIHHWVFGKNNRMALATYTIAIEDLASEDGIYELNQVSEILEKIKIVEAST